MPSRTLPGRVPDADAASPRCAPQLLQLWMPNTEERETLGGGRRRRQQPVAASLALLIEAHPLVLQHLVRCKSLSQQADW